MASARAFALVSYFALCSWELVGGEYGGHDLFTSLGQLHELWKNENAVVDDMRKAIKNLDVMRASLQRYIDSHESVHLNQAPNFDYLGQPINSYFLIRHVALGWNEIRTRVFEAENATRRIFDELRNREAEKLPGLIDVEGGAHGIARLHSLYELDGEKMVREGVVKADIKNGIKATSDPSVKKLAGWDIELISRTAAANGLWNTAVDFYDFTLKTLREEEKLEEAAFEMFLEKDLNITAVEKERRAAIIYHDQTLVRRGPRGSNFKTHGLPVDKNMRKKKKFKRKQFRLTNPMRNISEVLMAEAGELPDAHFRTNVQAEILCTGDTFRNASEDSDLYCFYAHNDSPWLRLGPMRLELKNRDPYVAVIRQLLYPHECNNVTKFLGPTLDFPPGRMSGKATRNDWTMKNTWPVETHHISLEKLTRRVEHVTGLLASSSLGQSDAFMCGNYGIGGYYGVHPDYNRYDERKFRDAASGINRISTVMTVLEQPAAGGATVFPYLGVASFPEQGSGVWWYNTRSDAHVDQMTQHMACPVLLGQKWIGNKWIHYADQWKRKPCGLEFNSRIPGTYR